MNKEERLAKLKNLMKDVNKKHKEVVLDFASSQGKWERLLSGIKEFDEKTGGGFPYGHLSIVWGQAGCGKSTMMYSTIAQAQKAGKIVVFLDLENSFSNERAKLIGVNVEELVMGHYTVAEQALDTIISLAKKKAVDVIVLDSIHSMAPKGEVEDKKGQKSVESDTMALLARKMGQFFRMATTHVYKANIALIMIGQTRTDLGGFIALQKLSGGNALIHNSVLTSHMRRGPKNEAPTVDYKLAWIDPDGKFHLNTKHEMAGFCVVLKIDKKQCDGGANEGEEMRMPFYYETGFVSPQHPNMSLPIIIDPNATEEQVEIIKGNLVEKGYVWLTKELTVQEHLESKPKEFQDEVKKEIEKQESKIKETKKKRGRPKGKKK